MGGAGLMGYILSFLAGAAVMLVLLALFSANGRDE